MEHIQEHDLCAVAFGIDAFNKIWLLSGLVDLMDIAWSPKHQVLFFFVKARDKTGVLFNQGTLKGDRIGSYKCDPQGLMVEWAGPPLNIGRGGN
jgi:hypothetical protein